VSGSAIAGCGIALPEKELHNKELAERFGRTEEWIFERTGIETRRIAVDGESTASLGTLASRRALDAAGVVPEEIDLVIVATSTPDFQMPSAASLVQDAIGASGAGAFDLNAACSGFLYALAQAAALIDAGTVERVVVCGADTLTHVTDPADLGTSILFGDGAGAVVVEKIEGENRLGPFNLLSDGAKADLLYIPPAEGVMKMRGREVYKHAVEGMTAAIRDIVAAAGLSIDDVDAVVAHQANARILEGVASRLDLPEERVLSHIARFGNTSAASIPIELAYGAEGGALTEDSVVVVTAFGAGFAWGAGIVRWGTGRAANDSPIGDGVPERSRQGPEDRVSGRRPSWGESNDG
jgi:3-oxoacyl-[acyl-carrier-protein] synthase III